MLLHLALLCTLRLTRPALSSFLSTLAALPLVGVKLAPIGMKVGGALLLLEQTTKRLTRNGPNGSALSGLRGMIRSGLV